MERAKAATGQPVNRALLMGRMMGRLGVDLESVAHETLGIRLRTMINRCRGCGQTDLCQRWVAGEETSRSYRDFCPNADAFVAFFRTD